MLGSELVEVLRRDGWRQVVGVGRRRVRGGETVPWDIGREEPPAQLRREWDVIVNAAADTRWTLSPEDAFQANVASVDALRALVGPRTHVIHVSTAYAGGPDDDVSSAELSDYRNTYEWSKAHAERLVRQVFVGATIVRPSLIVGRRGDGRAARFSGIYTLLRGIVVGTIPAIVSTPTSYLDLVPVDDVAAVIADVATGPPGEADLLTVAGGDRGPCVEEVVTTMVNTLNCWRHERDQPPLEVPRIIAPESWERFFRPFFDQYLSHRQRRIIELLHNYESYLQIDDPVPATHRINDVLDCLGPSVRYWADANPRVACLSAHRWAMSPELHTTVVSSG